MSREWVLPADSTAPATARCAIAALAGPAIEADAVLVASELVTNAVRHGAAPVIMRVSGRGERLRIEVLNRRRSDAALGAAAPFDLPGPGTIGGRGLAIIDRLAVKWGWDENEEMTTVWAELDSTRT